MTISHKALGSIPRHCMNQSGRVVHICNLTLRGKKQEAQELKVIFTYIESLRSALNK